ncbi:MAG: hypothetical protein AAB420_04175 [Patescibacteria group bacterium]
MSKDNILRPEFGKSRKELTREERVKQLWDEAELLRSQGRLEEATQKWLEAVKLGEVRIDPEQQPAEEQERATDQEVVDFFIERIDNPVGNNQEKMLNAASRQVPKIQDETQRKRLIEVIRRYRGPEYHKGDW